MIAAGSDSANADQARYAGFRICRMSELSFLVPAKGNDSAVLQQNQSVETAARQSAPGGNTALQNRNRLLCVTTRIHLAILIIAPSPDRAIRLESGHVESPCAHHARDLKLSRDDRAGLS